LIDLILTIYWEISRLCAFKQPPIPKEEEPIHIEEEEPIPSEEEVLEIEPIEYEYTDPPVPETPKKPL
jgi:hypothetical protein